MPQYDSGTMKFRQRFAKNGMNFDPLVPWQKAIAVPDRFYPERSFGIGKPVRLSLRGQAKERQK
jgi:hypothetical protein